MLIVSAMAATSATAQTTDPGVLINGMVWATRNVAAPGTFAETPESAGMLYHFGEKNVCYNAVDVARPANWIDGMSELERWPRENDPSPEGWRVPTPEEFETLLDEERVAREWIESRKGFLFTDLTTGAQLFLPMPGYRDQLGEMARVGQWGSYFADRVLDRNPVDAHVLALSTEWGYPCVYTQNRTYASSIRSVTEEDTTVLQATKDKSGETVTIDPQPVPRGGVSDAPGRAPAGNVAVESTGGGVPESSDAPEQSPLALDIERTIVGTWVSQFVEVLNATAVFTFNEDGTCDFKYIDKEGYYEDFSMNAVFGRELTYENWEVTNTELVTDGKAATLVQTICCTGTDVSEACFLYPGGDAFKWSIYELKRATSPDQIPQGKVKEKPVVTAPGNGSFIVGTFEGVEQGCSWGSPTGKVSNPGTITFSPDGTCDLLGKDAPEPYYWTVAESGIVRKTTVQKNDDPCQREYIDAKGDLLQVGLHYHDGSWKMSSYIFVFEHEGFVYVQGHGKRKRVN